jgi:hypothetical protein
MAKVATEELNGIETMIAAAVIPVVLGSGLIWGFKRWLDKREEEKRGTEQLDAAKHAAEPEYQAALSLSTLFSNQIYLNAVEKQKYQTIYAQVADKVKMGSYYKQITLRNLGDDVNKFISAVSQDQANKNSNANADSFSTYKVDANGKAISNVNTAEFIVPKSVSFKIYNDLGAEKMKSTLWKFLATNTSSGSWQPTGRGLYVGEIIGFTAKWLEDTIDHSVSEYNSVLQYIKRVHSQEKVFFKVWGVDGKNWYWVDAIEFKREKAKAVNGLSGLPTAHFNLIFS